MNEMSLIPEDWMAAQEAIRLRPPLCGEQEFDVLASYAEHHAAHGDSLFRLLYGLRRPRNCRERWRIELERQEIDDAEYRSRLEAHERQPVNREMVDSLYAEMLERLDWIEAFWGAVVNRCRDFEIGRNSRVSPLQRDRYIAEAFRPMSLAQIQIDEIVLLAEQVRVARTWGPAVCTGFNGSCALTLIKTVQNTLYCRWTNSVTVLQERHADNYGRLYPPEFFLKAAWELTAFSELVTLLRQEAAGIRLTLAPGDLSAAPYNPDLTVINQISVQSPPVVVNNHIKLDQVDDKRAKSPKTKPERPPPTHEINFKNWAFGLEDGKRWILFHRNNRRWDQRGSGNIAPGHQDRLLTAFAEGNGALEQKAAILLQRTYYPRTSDTKILELIKNTISDLRQRIRGAISNAANCTVASTLDPLPLMGNSWVADIQIGFVIVDDANDRQFRLKEDLEN